MKAAIVQFKASASKQKNLGRILSYVERAAGRGASLCAFPEFMMLYTSSSQTPEQLASEAEPVTGEFVSSIAEAGPEERHTGRRLHVRGRVRGPTACMTRCSYPTRGVG